MIHDPKWSPDQSRVSFLRDHDLWVVGLDGRETRVTTGGDDRLLNGELDWVYPEELGIASGYAWSADGRRLAYLQLDESKVTEFPLVDYRPRLGRVTPELYPKAGDPNPVPKVGVVAPGGPTTWIDLGPDPDIYVPRFGWLPDGRVFVQRLNRQQTKLDFLIADPETGAAKALFSEEDPAWVSVHDDLAFLKDGFVWSSERDGWRHLYFYTYDGAFRRLTQGAWEVTRLLGADGAWVYFESTEGDFLQRHAWKAPLAGGERQRLTGPAGWHSVTLSPSREHFLDLHSTAGSPPRLQLNRIDGSTLALVEYEIAPEVGDYDLPRPEFVTVKADGVELPAMVLKPADFTPSRKYPVLVHTYGGPGAQLVADRWGGGTYLWHGTLAARGIVVFTLDNRGSGGRGRDWERMLHKRLGAVELKDQLLGVEWLKSQPWVDASRIGIWGWSYGGYMTCAAMTRSDAFKAGIAVAPVTDWRLYDTIYTERYLKRPIDNGDGYVASSPIHEAAKLSGRLLLVHGTHDDNVHFQNAVVFADRLIEARKPFEFMLYPGKSHGIWGENCRVHLFEMMTEFLLRNL
jgi:dipeptidyl-peptidase-4